MAKYLDLTGLTYLISKLTALINTKANTSHTHDVYFDSGTARTANTVLASPNGSNGGASFRKLVISDLPITYGTSALTPGSSGLATGNIYLQYE